LAAADEGHQLREHPDTMVQNRAEPRSDPEVAADKPSPAGASSPLTRRVAWLLGLMRSKVIRIGFLAFALALLALALVDESNSLLRQVERLSVPIVLLALALNYCGLMCSLMVWRELLADLGERYSQDEVRVHYEQNLILPHVKLDDVPQLWKALGALDLDTPNRGLVTDIIACPGLDYCALANARAIPIAQQIALKFADPALAEKVGELGIKISGCINACSRKGMNSRPVTTRSRRSMARNAWAASPRVRFVRRYFVYIC